MENSSGFIPPEVWFDILKRLPTKSLSRFSCVSNSWNSLIRSSIFIAAHHAAAAAAAVGNTHLFVESFRNHFKSLGGFDKHLLIDLKPLKNGLNFLQASKCTIPSSVTVLAYANGVLLGSVQLGNKVRHVLCNPMIHRYVLLPGPVSPLYIYQLGLGFVPSKNDIGVVEIIHGFDAKIGPPSIVRVCYTREKVWKTIAGGLPSTYLPSDLPDNHCSTNGRVHWLAHSRYENFRSAYRRDHLLVFNFERERFETLDLPGELVKDLKPLGGIKLLLFKQKLSVLLHLYRTHKYSLWSLTEYSDRSSWAKMWSFDSEREEVLFSFVAGWRADYELIISRGRKGITRVYHRGVGSDNQELYVFPFKRDVYATYICGFNESLFLSDHPEALPLTQLQSIISK